MLILFLIWIYKECTVMNRDRLSLFPKLWTLTESQHSDTFQHFVAQSNSIVNLFSATPILTLPQVTIKNFCIISPPNGSETHDWLNSGVRGKAVRIRPGYNSKEHATSSQIPRGVGPNWCQCGQVTKRPNKRFSLGNEMPSFLRL